MKLIIEPLNEVELSKVKEKGGRIYFRHFLKINDEYFPDKNWTDLSCPIIATWLSNIKKIDDGEECILHFMDGSDAIKLTRISDELEFIFGISDDNFIPNSIKPVKLKFIEFQKQLISQAQYLAKTLDQNQVTQNDYYYSELVKSIKEFEADEGLINDI